MTEDVAIQIEGLWKRYGFPWLGSLQGKQRQADSPNGSWALRDISFNLRRGETLGIIGRNGAGKSTLLKVLAGVTPATRGRVRVRGRIFPMIELNAGMHAELTGRENARLLGAIMGLSRREIEARMAEIEEFCELGIWFDRPVRAYSSGMTARLGFAVAMNVDADVLLVDEVLAVGDMAFQQRCYDRLERMRSLGTTVMLVSHNIRQVARLCDPVMLLEQGQIAEYGTAAKVTSLYYERCSDIALDWDKSRFSPTDSIIRSTGDVVIENLMILDDQGRPTDRVRFGDPVTFRVEFTAKRYIEHPVIGVGILTSDLLVLARVHTEMFSLEGQGWVDCTIPKLPLLPGIYSTSASVTQRNGARLFKGKNLARFRVIPGDEDESHLDYGIIALDSRWRISQDVQTSHGNQESRG
jgi:ABC-type polysaccharide/polyol phosphate transport system ATPase subunit